MAITLPEITIEGTPEPELCKATDWWCQGFVFGVNNPEIDPGPPAPLNEESMNAYYAGVTAGKEARANYDADQPTDGPSIGPGRPETESYDKLEREYQEAWAEFLGHRHEPHIEIEEYETVVPSPPPLVILPP